jgi:peptide/nickel transport system substrate-binding protein
MRKKLSMLLVMILLLMNALPFMSFGAVQDETILKIGVKQEPDSLNPFASWEMASYEMFMLTYDSLVKFDRNYEVVPSLASSWELAEDQLTWTFHLRDDVKWHDGEPFTSADVKFTYEAILNSEMGMYYTSLEDIVSIETPDDYTVVITTGSPKANMLQNVTPILPAHIWSELSIDDITDYEDTAMIGTGPFKFVSWDMNQQIVLDRNPDYFNGQANVDHMIYVFYANNDTMVQALQNGEIDIALDLDYVDIKSALSETNITDYAFEENGFTELAFNQSEWQGNFNQLIQDKGIRQAISYAIDKQKIVDLVYDGSSVPGTTYIPPSQGEWHYEPTGDALRSYDPEKAIALLEAEGFTNVDSDGYRSNDAGEKLSFLLLSRSDNTSEVKVGQMVQSYLKAVGIELSIETVDDGVLYDRTMGDKDYDMFIWGWSGDIDPTVLLNVLTTDNIDNLNDVYYSNPDYDAVVSAQSHEMDAAKRVEMVHEAQKILYEELPYDILYYSEIHQLVRNDLITGIVPTVSGAAFFANTVENYIDAAFVAETPAADVTSDAASDGSKDGSTGSSTADNETTDTDSNNNSLVIGIVVIAIAGGGFYLLQKRKSGKTKEDQKNEW